MEKEKFEITKEIKEKDGLYYYYLNGDESISYTDRNDCEDDMEDEYADMMNDEHHLVCLFCNEWFYTDQVEHRIEDSTFTAPYGSTIVIGGDVGSLPVCPNCKRDLDEC